MAEKQKNKKPLIALALIAMIGVVGGTFAYFTSSASFENIFKTSPYSTEFEEEFESPTSWTPGTTTDKTVIAKNNGDVDVAVRVSYEEEWTSANGDSLALVQNGNTAAVINFANSSDWTLVDGYYYYNYKLAKDESTSSFIESVTFNKDIVSDTTCTTTENKKVCTSTGDGYDGATYKLTINVETVQYDAYASYWNTTATISSSSKA